MGSRVDYDAPGQSCTRMAYSADGTRYKMLSYFFDCLVFKYFIAGGLIFKILCIFSFFPGQIADFFHVGLVKMENPILLNGMKVKVPSDEVMLVSESDPWVLFNLIRRRTGSWSLGMSLLSSFGTLIMLTS